jgi:hypothetical protein
MAAEKLIGIGERGKRPAEDMLPSLVVRESTARPAV